MKNAHQDYSEALIHANERDAFARLFHIGELKEIDWKEIPPAIIQHFERYSRRFISPKEYHPYNFTSAHVLEHENGDRTYIAEQKQTYDATSKTTEVLVYFIEMRGDIEIGHGELRRDISENPILGGEPFVGFTQTEKGYKRQHLGERRLNVMNAYAQLRFGKPLFSGDTIFPEARAMFEKLAEEGKVEVVDDSTGDPDRRSYRMQKTITEESVD